MGVGGFSNLRIGKSYSSGCDRADSTADVEAGGLKRHQRYVVGVRSTVYQGAHCDQLDVFDGLTVVCVSFKKTSPPPTRDTTQQQQQSSSCEHDGRTTKCVGYSLDNRSDLLLAHACFDNNDCEGGKGDERMERGLGALFFQLGS